jgi:hypothetical protein
MRPCQGSELGQNKCVRGEIDITNRSKESPACIDLDVVPMAENNWKVRRCSLNETLSIGAEHIHISDWGQSGCQQIMSRPG